MREPAKSGMRMCAKEFRGFTIRDGYIVSFKEW